MSEMSQPSTSEEVGSQEDQPTLLHPWPYLEEFFESLDAKTTQFLLLTFLNASIYTSTSYIFTHLSVLSTPYFFKNGLVTPI